MSLKFQTAEPTTRLYNEFFFLFRVLHSQKFFQKVRPVNFATFATPHLGLPAGAVSLREKLFAYFGPKLLSRTGEHFYGKDNWLNTGKPLLDVMADKSASRFLQRYVPS